MFKDYSSYINESESDSSVYESFNSSVGIEILIETWSKVIGEEIEYEIFELTKNQARRQSDNVPDKLFRAVIDVYNVRGCEYAMYISKKQAERIAQFLNEERAYQTYFTEPYPGDMRVSMYPDEVRRLKEKTYYEVEKSIHGKSLLDYDDICRVLEELGVDIEELSIKYKYKLLGGKFGL